MRKWCTLGDLQSLTRAEVLDANDLLDALEEAEDAAAAERERRR